MATPKKRGRKALHGAIVGQVVDLVARGKTGAEIVAMSQVKSQGTISKIKKSRAELIAKKKEEYIRKIDQATGGDLKQAAKLSELLEATIPVYNRKGEYMGDKPDSRVQLDTVKYIDELKGRKDKIQQLTQNNLIISKDLDKYTQ